MSVPNTIESATSRLGFFTSAAVKPMLFQASAENSEPTCATPNATKMPNAPLAAVTVGSSRRNRLRAPHGPQMRKIIRNRARVARHKNTDENQPDQRQRLRRSKNVLNQLSQTHAQRVQKRQENNHQDSDELLDRKTDGIPGRKIDRMHDPGLRRNRGKQNAQITCKSNSHGGNRPRLNH